MTIDSSVTIVAKVWNYTHVPKNAVVGYGDNAEQYQIVAEIEALTTAIDHLEADLVRQITRSNRLRQSILASAFSGRLVGHHHDDHHQNAYA